MQGQKLCMVLAKKERKLNVRYTVMGGGIKQLILILLLYCVHLFHATEHVRLTCSQRYKGT